MKILRYHVSFDGNLKMGYTRWVPSLPGCVTFGKTIEEAIEMVRDAIEIYVETLISHGEEGLPGKA